MQWVRRLDRGVVDSGAGSGSRDRDGLGPCHRKIAIAAQDSFPSDAMLAVKSWECLLNCC